MRNRPPSQPRRTCVGCRQTRAKHELIRLCGGETQRLEIDLRGDKPGRGVYLCPQSSCISEAVVKNALSRSLRDGVRSHGGPELEREIIVSLEKELNRLIPGGVGLERADEVQNRLIPAMPEKKAAKAAELWYKYRHLKLDAIKEAAEKGRHPSRAGNP